MTALLALALAASCEHPALAALPFERQATACALLAKPGPDAGRAQRDELAEIYQRPGFEHARQADASAINAWLLQLRAKLLAFFETSGAEKYSNVTRVGVLVVALLAVALGFGRLASSRRPRGQVTARPVGPEGLAMDQPEQHLARAQGLIDSAPREALRQGLLALLSWLEAQHYARPDRVKTNRELVTELPLRGALPAVVERVRALCEFYDQAFYSLEPVSAADARSFLERVAPLVEVSA